MYNPVQDGGAKRPRPARFSPVSSTKIGIGHQDFLTFSFNSKKTQKMLKELEIMYQNAIYICIS